MGGAQGPFTTRGSGSPCSQHRWGPAVLLSSQSGPTDRGAKARGGLSPGRTWTVHGENRPHPGTPPLLSPRGPASGSWGTRQGLCHSAWSWRGLSFSLCRSLSHPEKTEQASQPLDPTSPLPTGPFPAPCRPASLGSGQGHLSTGAPWPVPGPQLDPSSPIPAILSLFLHLQDALNHTCLRRLVLGLGTVLSALRAGELRLSVPGARHFTRVCDGRPRLPPSRVHTLSAREPCGSNCQDVSRGQTFAPSLWLRAGPGTSPLTNGPSLCPHTCTEAGLQEAGAVGATECSRG